MTKPLDVLVIGAGQAGLAAGHHLERAGKTFGIVEGAAEIGTSWRRRYRSLTLFTPRRLSSLPGRQLDGDPEGYAGKDEFADYLQAYARDLPVELGKYVIRLRQGTNQFLAELSDGDVRPARQVIIATGGFQRPILPVFAGKLAVPQLTTDTYRDPASLPEGTILVVGDGASGRDIAAELAAVGRTTLLATGKPRRLFPERLVGQSTWWWLDRVGLLRAPTASWIGRRLRAADAFPDRNRSVRKLTRMGVQFVKRVSGGAGKIVMFENSDSRTVDGVVWCIGYRDDVDWIDVPGTHAGGSFLHREGVSPVPGLYFVGRPWQRNRASGLILGVGEDAERIVRQLP